MGPIRQVTRSRPQYFRGQLLEPEDFVAEQEHHRGARLLHNLQFHQWGVVQGLTISIDGDSQARVSPGLALDSLGRELVLGESVVVDLSEFGPNRNVFLNFAFEEKAEEQRKSEYGEGPTRMVEYSVLSASASPGSGSSVTLGAVHLNAQGKASAKSIDYTQTKYASSILAPAAVGYRELADGSITEAKLGTGLRTGWVRTPFKPFPLEGKKPFRIGPTESRSTDEGAAGSMGISAPPGVTRITRFRTAGELNEGAMKISLYRCGWDEEEGDHEKTTLLEKEIAGETPGRSFNYTVDLDEKLGMLDAQFHALSIVVEVTKKTSISLVAIEFGYPAIT